MARSTGIWKSDSVIDVAESVGIPNLPEDVAAALAGDVEYRLCELIEEATKFMRHSRRTRLKVDDLDQALKVRNLEPLWGFTSETAHMPFKKTVTATGTVYHVEDDEIDLSKVIKTDLPAVPRDISFTAHWLAIEGVQPLIKENPTPQELARYAPKPATASLLPSSSAAAAANGQPSTVTPLVKHVLSRELQLYFTRLTDALSRDNASAGATNAAGAPSNELKDAALGSVKSDPGLHQLVPYLIAWGGEQIANHLHDLLTLQRALDLFDALFENPTLVLEPYLHQLTPPILTCLVTSALPYPSDPSEHPQPADVRALAASLLHKLLQRHAYAYPTLLPRVTKTLLRGLAGEGRGLGGRYGAALGLSAIAMGVGSEPAAQAGVGGGAGGGNRAIREWIGGGLKALGEVMEGEEEGREGERDKVVGQVVDTLKLSLPPFAPSHPSSARPSHADLSARYGPLFASHLLNNWDRVGHAIWDAVDPRALAATEGERNEGDGELQRQLDLTPADEDEDGEGEGEDAEGEEDDDEDAAERSQMEE
ncbi:hypothetical protein JCM8097_006073 [Rhodosporidiobolus ruineniae]